MNSTPTFIINIIKQYWTPGKKILEIGCGPAFLREFFGADYIGTDITDEPYNENLPRNVDIVCAAENLLMKNDMVDIVTIKSSFYLFTEHDRVLMEVNRVLKSHGLILIFDYTRKTQKKLQKSEHEKIYPCWTQLGLKRKMMQSGFTDCQILSAEGDKANLLQIMKNEMMGTWAIAKGAKP